MSTISVEGVSYGQGRAFATDAAGVTHEVAQLTGVDVEFAIEKDSYKGGYDSTIVSVIKSKSVSGKASAGRVDGRLLAKCLGASSASGKTVVYSETHTIAASSVTVDHDATYVDTLVVKDASGAEMTKVASAPQVGEFSVAAGVYTFNAAESGDVSIDYRATDASAGTTYTVSGAAPAQAPTFRLVLSQPDVEGTPQSLVIFAAVIDKLSKGGKAESYNESSIDFTAQLDASGKLVEFSY